MTSKTPYAFMSCCTSGIDQVHSARYDLLLLSSAFFLLAPCRDEVRDARLPPDKSSEA